MVKIVNGRYVDRPKLLFSRICNPVSSFPTLPVLRDETVLNQTRRLAVTTQYFLCVDLTSDNVELHIRMITFSLLVSLLQLALGHWASSIVIAIVIDSCI